MGYLITVDRVEPTLIASIRKQAAQSELSRVVPAACGEIWNYARSAGLANPGRMLAIYHDCEINLEVGVEVSEPFVGDGEHFCSSLPAGPAATTAHFGDYDRLADAHGAVTKFVKDKGYELAGPSWEIYGHMTGNPSEVRTDVFYLLREQPDIGV
jgi:effector-binding domain-containing protein